ncbi:MAG TPA: RluA family pseudouridine synthase [Cellvibrionaceae bacterium]|nr:RluA family pseudouridine synthase [Cellvibrionaceae bacterium]HMW47020.1 RluA family pseudouridine synthase [Cellvibrionaceae bacterium]HMW72233.1 RluA family pseudouridine synthase [Cellvibrionaceae bacterium]HMY41157.1 RluA family pseudouridine synthase [Marinagarivorans sp.]HNG58789.1 RluA family pseudouridine synthase [Cellvibrionaceae bacterium]
MSKTAVTLIHQGASAIDLVDLIASHCALSKAAIKRGLTFGGGWIKPAGQSAFKRCRKAKASIKPGDTCAFYFDEHLIAQQWPQPEVIFEHEHFGIWYKPRHQVTQGSKYGDANSLERQINQLRQKPVWLVHRLDSAACGLVLFAYTAAACAKLNNLLQNQQIHKIYQAQVLGQIAASGRIDVPLDGKNALTEFTRIAVDEHSSLVSIRLHTGRLHQIRRHFAALGHPLLGDPRYGSSNAHSDGLKLVASELRFTDPISRTPLSITLPREYCLF